MSTPEVHSIATNSTAPDSSVAAQGSSTYNDCLTCRIIGSGAFAATGIYALRMSRRSAPGSIVGKRIMGGLGVCEISVFVAVLSTDACARFFGGECAEVANVRLLCKLMGL
jgi:hypothetical protein